MGVTPDCAGEALVEWLGQKPGWSVLDCLLESEKVQGVFVDISFEKKFGREGWYGSLVVGGGYME